MEKAMHECTSYLFDGLSKNCLSYPKMTLVPEGKNKCSTIIHTVHPTTRQNAK
jgi:hypothetical protein